jgi:prepilin-type N-terminal cleavage/methylation domain-containing protein
MRTRTWSWDAGRRGGGFTLVELLVVVSIIVVLLALLMPAMGRAVYSAALVKCAASQKVIGSGVMQYAMEYRRSYPDRSGLSGRPANENPLEWLNAMNLARPNLQYDMRPQLQKLFDVNRTLQCPLTDPVELMKTEADVVVEASYTMWWGWRYVVGGQMYAGMYRMGDGFEWGGSSYNILAGDIDLRYEGSNAQASHPDRDPKTLYAAKAEQELVYQHRSTVSRWVRAGSDRGKLDLNYLFDDGSARRYDNVTGWRILDGRMDRVPIQFDRRRPSDEFQIPRQ